MINNLQESQTPEYKYTFHSVQLIFYKTNGGVNELLEFIRKNPNLNVKQLSQNFEKPLRRVERWIKEFKGSTKNGGYDIK